MKPMLRVLITEVALFAIAVVTALFGPDWLSDRALRLLGRKPPDRTPPKKRSKKRIRSKSRRHVRGLRGPRLPLRRPALTPARPVEADAALA